MRRCATLFASSGPIVGEGSILASLSRQGKFAESLALVVPNFSKQRSVRAVLFNKPLDGDCFGDYAIDGCIANVPIPAPKAKLREIETKLQALSKLTMYNGGSEHSEQPLLIHDFPAVEAFARQHRNDNSQSKVFSRCNMYVSPLIDVIVAAPLEVLKQLVKSHCCRITLNHIVWDSASQLNNDIDQGLWLALQAATEEDETAVPFLPWLFRQPTGSEFTALRSLMSLQKAAKDAPVHTVGNSLLETPVTQKSDRKTKTPRTSLPKTGRDDETPTLPKTPAVRPPVSNAATTNKKPKGSAANEPRTKL